MPDHELVVIDDGSRDATADVAAQAGARVLRHPFNLGYGAALQTGFKYALEVDAPWVVQMDADGQHLPAEVPALVALLAARRVRRRDRLALPRAEWLRDGRRAHDRARPDPRARAISRASISPIPPPGFQALSRRALALYAGDWFPTDYPDVDVRIAAARAGLRIREVPVQMAAGVRASTLHSGWKPIYYAYKMLLSLWATTTRRAPHQPPPPP